MKRQRLYSLGIAALLICAAGLFLSGCTVKDKRAPGPVLVWLSPPEEAATHYRLAIEDFKKMTGLEIKAVFKKPYEVRAALIHTPEQLQGVDLIEVDLFDLELAEGLMRPMDDFIRVQGPNYSFYGGPMAAGVFADQRKFLPFRLSWPVLLVSGSVEKPPRTFRELLSALEEKKGELFVPGLEDREIFAFACSVVRMLGGDPGNPKDPAFSRAFRWFSELAPFIRFDCSARRSRDFPNYPEEERPLAAVVWPEALVPLILDGAVGFSLKAAPLPCARLSRCSFFFFGRYLGIPKSAPHPKDAFRLLSYLLSPKVQNELLFVEPWLPPHSLGWSDLGARKAGYDALAKSARNLMNPPRNLARLEKALARAARAVLFERKDPGRALIEFRKEMKRTGENE